jgi:hypothetical protein
VKKLWRTDIAEFAGFSVEEACNWLRARHLIRKPKKTSSAAVNGFARRWTRTGDGLSFSELPLTTPKWVSEVSLGVIQVMEQHNTPLS